MNDVPLKGFRGRRLSQEELAHILGEHRKWIESNETKGKKANLSGEDLSGLNLARVNLSKADLSKADLTDANLQGANLTEANLQGANLTRANFEQLKASSKIKLNQE